MPITQLYKATKGSSGSATLADKFPKSVVDAFRKPGDAAPSKPDEPTGDSPPPQPSESTTVQPASAASDPQGTAPTGNPDPGTVQVVTPATVPVTATTNTDEPTIVALDSEKCYGCGHLFPVMTKLHKSCHYSRGNEQCPAKRFVIRQVVNLDYFAKRLAKYAKEGDVANYERKTRELTEKSRKGLLSSAEFQAIKAKEHALLTESGNDEDDD